MNTGNSRSNRDTKQQEDVYSSSAHPLVSGVACHPPQVLLPLIDMILQDSCHADDLAYCGHMYATDHPGGIVTNFAEQCSAQIDLVFAGQLAEVKLSS